MRIGGKIVGLAAMVLMTAAMFIPTIAVAEETSLCAEDMAESSCPEGKVATHVHLTTPKKAQLLSSTANVECEALFLGDAISEKGSGNPLEIIGNFTYPMTGCKTTSGTSCEIIEMSAHAIIKVLRLGHELADVTHEAEVNFHCGSLINCTYNGVGLTYHGLGPLLASGKNGEVGLEGQTANKTGGLFCPKTAKLDIDFEPLEALYISPVVPPPHKTALCTTDDALPTCLEEHKPSSVDFKDSAAEFLTNLVNSKCEGLISGTVGAAGKPQEVKVESKYSACSGSCTITEISGGSQLFFLLEGEPSKETASATSKGLEIFIKCGSTVKCAFGPVELSGEGLGALATGDNGHITFSKDSLGKGEGLLCPTEASLDALFVASSPTYIREDYVKPPTSLCSKDEKSPFCKSENQLKSIDYKDKAVELLTNLINVKCEGLASGTVGTPANGEPLEIKPELTYTGCSGGCFVTSVAGPGKIMLQREGVAEEAKATSEGFEIFIKCGTTIKCLLGPEKMMGKALGALTTGDNGHLTFSKVSMGKGEGATCPSEATLDALFVASSAAYIG